MNKSLLLLVAAGFALSACDQASNEDQGPDPYSSRYQPLPSEPVLLQGATVLTGTGERLDNADGLALDRLDGGREDALGRIARFLVDGRVKTLVLVGVMDDVAGREIEATLLREPLSMWYPILLGRVGKERLRR